MGSKVYVLTAGEYSDCHIMGIFTNKEHAEMLCEKVNQYAYTQVAEWNLDAMSSSPAMRILKWEAWIDLEEVP